MGCYCVSMAQLITGQEPIAVTGTAELDPVQGVDLHAVGTLAFPRAVLAQVECAVALEQPDQLRISGAEGEIVIDRPCWIPECRDSDTAIELRTPADTEVIKIGRSGHIFALELDGFAQLIDAGAGEWERSWPVVAHAHARPLARRRRRQLRLEPPGDASRRATDAERRLGVWQGSSGWRRRRGKAS